MYLQWQPILAQAQGVPGARVRCLAAAGPIADGDGPGARAEQGLAWRVLSSTGCKGWKVVGSSCTTTELGGKGAGTYIALPRAVQIKKANGQLDWDISPQCSKGRACMALAQTEGGSWIALFSLY